MCCFFTVLVFLGPRVAGIIWWLIQPARWNLAFDTFIFPILGIIFLPWTLLMYVIVAPGGLTGLEWVFVGLMLVFDIGSYVGGGWGNRSRFGS
ncbi:MAG: hypothetical protein ACERK1_07740 [Anaerolineales bacterium]